MNHQFNAPVVFNTDLATMQYIHRVLTTTPLPLVESAPVVGQIETHLNATMSEINARFNGAASPPAAPAPAEH